MEAGQTRIHRGKHMEKTKDPKLNGEQRPLGFGSKTVCKGMRSDAEEGVAKGCRARTSVKKVHAD